MKNIFFCVLFLIPCLLMGQRIKKEQVPSPVQKAFSQRFPNALMLRWSKGEGVYEVDFQRNEDNISAVFEENGKWISTQSEIEVSQVPAPVKRTYSSIYKQQPEDAEKLEKAEGAVEYVLDSPDATTTIYFSEKGELLRKETAE